MKLKLTLTTATVGTALALPCSAWAQAPPNDTFEQATVISLPFSQILDTTQATTDSTDAEALAACESGPRPRRRDGLVRVHAARRSERPHLDGPGSPSYAAGVAVLTGHPAAFRQSPASPALRASRRQRV